MRFPPVSEPLTLQKLFQVLLNYSLFWHGCHGSLCWCIPDVQWIERGYLSFCTCPSIILWLCNISFAVARSRRSLTLFCCNLWPRLLGFMVDVIVCRKDLWFCHGCSKFQYLLRFYWECDDLYRKICTHFNDIDLIDQLILPKTLLLKVFFQFLRFCVIVNVTFCLF